MINNTRTLYLSKVSVLTGEAQQRTRCIVLDDCGGCVAPLFLNKCIKLADAANRAFALMSVVDDAQSLWNDLSDDERLWLKAFYEREGGRLSEAEMLAELDGEISRSFEPQQVTGALISARRLTPYGVLAVNPGSDVLEELRETIELIRSWIVEDPNLREVTASEVADEVDISIARASLFLCYLEEIGDFVGSPTSGGDVPGYLEVKPRALSFLQFSDDLEDRLEETYLSRDSRGEGGIYEPPTPDQESPFMIHPVFQSRIAEIDNSFCFVLMPFRPDWSERVYKNIFRPAIEKAGYQCQRADESGEQIITESIWTDICRSRVIVADLTGKNENVMYEIGIAHTVGKPVVLLSQNEIDPPFDVSHHRVHVYEDTAAGPENVKEWLPSVIEDIVDEHDRRKRQELQLSSPPPAYRAGVGIRGDVGPPV